MSDHSQPYAWNPSSQRYERPSTVYAESQQRQDSGHQEQQDQRYAPAGTLNPPQHPHPEDWNPWAYLESGSERAYTPSQPAVGGARGALPDLPAHYDPYRLPSIQQQGIAGAYDPHEYQGPSGSSYVSSASRPSASASHQGRLPYLDENYNTAAYSGWSTTPSSDLSAQHPLESYILPPLNHPAAADSAAGSASLPRTDPPYTSSYARPSASSRDPRSSTYSSRPLPVIQASPTYQNFDSADRRSASLETGQYFGWTPSDTTISIPQERSLSDPYLAWERFQAFWKEYIQASEDLLVEQALRGELVNFTYQSMAQPLPTLAACEDLIRGFQHSYNNSYRITVDKLKQLIRGIHMVPNLPLSHIRISGTKQELIDRIIDVLRSLKNTQSPAYYEVAKLVGELQGIVYQSTNAPVATTAPANVPQPGTSAPGTSYARQYGSATYGDLVPNPSSTLRTTTPGSAYGADYAVRPAQFGLMRSPGRAGSSTTTTTAPAYGGASAAASSSTSNGYYQPNRPYSNSPNPGYRSGLNGSAGPPSSTSHLQAPRQAGSSGYGSSLSSQIPTSLPAPLPPKSAIAGQPAIPMNFKPSPFFNVVSAVSPVVTLPRSGPNERATAVAHVHLTEDQRTKLVAARQDPKAPQYQLRLYCTSSDFYHPNHMQYGTVRHVLPIDFPVSSEAKMNEVAVIANLRGIKKKPGTAPPAHVSNAKVGNPSRTSTNSTPPNNNSPIGSYALKLGSTKENNKVELVYMNTDKNYYLIVYFVEAFSVEQVVEKIKRERFRQKEDVLRSIHRAAEDPDIQATSSTISMKDPLTYTTLNTPIRSINCPHLQCFDAFCFLSMMENTPDWKCPVCNRAITSSINELVHDGFFQDIKDSLPQNGNVDTVVVEIDGTWRTEDYKLGNSKKVQEHQEKLRNGVVQSVGNSRASSIGLGKDGTPLDVKPEIGSSNTSLSVPNGTSRGNSKSKTPAAVIELDDDDDDDHPYGNDDTPPPPSRSQMNGNLTRGQEGTGSRVIDLTLSDSDDDDDGASSSIVGMGSRAPSIRTPGGVKSTGLSIPLSTNRTPVARTASSINGVGGATSIASSGSTVNGTANDKNASTSTMTAAGVKRRYDSEALYDDLWNNEDSNAALREREEHDHEGRPSQMARYI